MHVERVNGLSGFGGSHGTGHLRESGNHDRVFVNTRRKYHHCHCARLRPTTFSMESYNLKTAASYINNLLLARGLLRDGKSIEFAHPSRGEGGKEATMAQIINLVHDLILKRDVW